VDERAQKRSWRDRLTRAMTHRLKAWAQAVFSEPSGAGAALKTEVPPQEEASPSSPPTGWLKDMQGLKSGPPADWVQFVRRNARNGPARMANRISVPQPAPSAEPPPPQLSPLATRGVRAEEMAALPGTPAPPKGTSFMGEIPAVPRAEQRIETSGASAIETPRAVAPRAVPAPKFQELHMERPMDRPMNRFEPPEVSSPVPPRREVPEQASRPGQQVHPLASRADAHDPSQPERARDDGSLVARLLAPFTPRPQHSEDRFAAVAVPHERIPAAYPWGEEPTVERQHAPEQEPQEDLSTLIERSWPDLLEKEERQQAQRPSEALARPEIRWTGPWPDLPEVLPAESAETEALLRQWERLTRLDREQRGE
jgi:hypothetical protein